MGLNYKTEQEMFWASEFGDNYVDRNKNERYIAHRTALFSKIFARTRGIKNIIEFGANIGTDIESTTSSVGTSECLADSIGKKKQIKAVSLKVAPAEDSSNSNDDKAGTADQFFEMPLKPLECFHRGDPSKIRGRRGQSGPSPVQPDYSAAA